jgi:hypothetical protein
MSPARLPLPLPLVLSLLAWAPSGCLLVGDDGDGGSDDAPVMEGGTVVADGTAGGECFTPPACDPLAPECAANELCSEDLGAFRCMPVPEGTALVGEGEPCGAASCAPGLVCVSYCAGGAGCCLPLCDVEQPQCSMDRACLPLFTAGSTQCYAHVGVCVDA